MISTQHLSQALGRLGRTSVVRDAIEAGASLDSVLLDLGKMTDYAIERRLRLFAADCAARVLPIYEQENNHPAPRNAIITARRFTRFEATENELDATELSACVVSWKTHDMPACNAAAAAAWAAMRICTLIAPPGAVRMAARSAISAVEEAARDKEIVWQRDRLIERFEGEPEDWPLEEEK